MLLMQSTAAAPPPARSLQAPLLWRALAALTLLLSSCGSLEGAQQGDRIAAASQGEGRAGGTVWRRLQPSRVSTLSCTLDGGLIV